MHIAIPSQYIHEPTGYVAIIELPSLREVQKKCKRPKVFACAKGSFAIYYPKGLRPEVKEFILRHEKAHINGWPAHHPKR